MLVRFYKTKVLRFRRWSRKSYATFLTIGKHITIGSLKNIVADTLLPKQRNLKTSFNLLSFFSLESFLEETDDPPEEKLQLQLIITTFYNKKKYYERVKIFLKTFDYKWLNAAIVVAFSHFYLFTIQHKNNNSIA